MTTYVVPDGMKRKPTADEWETLLENRIPELIRRAKAGNLDPSALNFTMQKVIEGEVIGVLPVESKPKPLLELVGTVTVSATTKKFRAGANFLLKKDGGICSYLNVNFKGWFLEGDGKTEEPIGEQTLRYSRLRKSSADGPIITELGGEEKAETFLAEMFYLMKKQANGEAGVLLNNGWANVFYIKDQSGMLRVLRVDWDDDGWRVRACEVSFPGKWNADCRVFSRNSVLAPLESRAA